MKRQNLVMILAGASVVLAISLTMFRAEAHTPITTDLTWSKDIQAIFRDKCMSCHSPHGSAPSYVDLTTFGGKPGQSGARDWAKSIEEEILLGHMPPWKADGRFEDFANQRKLTKLERDMIIGWVQGGAPQGPQRELPAPEEFLTKDWSLGAPDMEIAMPAEFVVPAGERNGSTKFEFKVPASFGKDEKGEEIAAKWVTAYEFLPGDMKSVYSMTAWILDPADLKEEVIEVEVQKPYDPFADEAEAEEKRVRKMPLGRRFLGQYIKGDAPVFFPDESGKKLRAGSTIEVEVVYRKQGVEGHREETRDLSKLGLHFSTAPIDLLVETHRLANEDFSIAAGEKDKLVSSSMTLDENIHLVSLIPQLGLLATSFTARASYPDGVTKTLLHVPQFEHRWGSSYYFEEPIVAPAGTKIEIEAKYDNSAENRANPNRPPKDVKAGPSLDDERCGVFMDYYVDDHMIVITPTPTPKPRISSESGMIATEQFIQGGSLFGDEFDPNDPLGIAQSDPNAPTDSAVAGEEPEVATEPFWCPNRGPIKDGKCGFKDHAEAGKCPRCGKTLAPSITFFVEEKPAPEEPPKDVAGVSESPNLADTLGTLNKDNTIYWCPMRGTGPHDCGLKDYPAPGICEKCEMDLITKADFFVQKKMDVSKLAARIGDWKLSDDGLEPKYWCPIRGSEGHTLEDYLEPGKCPVCFTELVHAARFAMMRTYACTTPTCTSFHDETAGKLTVFYSPGLCPDCAEPVQPMGHMDHSPVHGGQLFMADNLYHHLEGTLPAKDTFRIYFYDDYKKPIDPRNFAGKLVFETFNEETEEFESKEHPLTFENMEDQFLTTKIPPVAEFPIDFNVKVWLSGEEKLFSFAFDALSIEPEPDAAKAKIIAHEHIARPPVQIPEKAVDVVREILARQTKLTTAISEKRFLDIHIPALDIVDLVQSLKLKEAGLPVRDRSRLRSIIPTVNLAALRLHEYGDSLDAARIDKGFAELNRAITELKSIFPEATKP